MYWRKKIRNLQEAHVTIEKASGQITVQR